MLLNKDVVDIEKPDGIYLLTFVVDEFSGLFSYPPIFDIIHSRSALIIIGALSYFLYWFNSNILVSSEGIITLQKSLVLHYFLFNSSLFSVSK